MSRPLIHLRFRRLPDCLLSLALASTLVVPLCGCGSTGTPHIPDPIPRDDRDIPPPKKQKIHILADGFDKQVARPVERAFDLSRQFRKLTGNRKEAVNVDAFDEVTNSSWFTNRNGLGRLSIEDIMRGPNRGARPDVKGPCTIIKAKVEGITPGFTIQDTLGGRYVVKMDPAGWPELATGAEVVSTKLLYAAGYNTPENYVVYFDPEILKVGDNVILKDRRGEKRRMTQADLQAVLDRIQQRPDGTIRAVASKFIDGKVLGPFRYYATRKDDPNDFIPHEHRRELRGLRQIAAWINHWDTKANNTLDAYVEEGGRRFVRHYLIDFGSTLGSQGDEPMPLWTGYESTVDPGQILKNTAGVGLYVPNWEKNRAIKYKSVGRFDWELFRPQDFKFIFPNPAFVNQTDRDGFWAAKIVTSFTNEQIRAAVDTGEYSNAEAAEFLTRVLIERRDTIGRYWFDRMSPLDRFSVGEAPDGGSELRCVDLAVERGYKDESETRYQHEIRGNGELVGTRQETSGVPHIPLPGDAMDIVEVRIRCQTTDGKWGAWVSAFLTTNDNPGGYAVIAIQR
jgi:hypothetical protein